MAVEVVNGGLKVGDRLVPIISGAVHYWRHERDLWEPILEKVKDMGFEMVETYIPWSVHEVERSVFDFGSGDEKKDIEGFLALCKKMDLWVMVRPGPHINSELTYFGYPERILADPDCQSVSASGTPVYVPTPPKMFPVPSYCSEKFFDETAIWYEAICAILEKHLHPEGKIVAIQVDNEMCHFFRTHPFDHDYSPGAAKLYAEFLEQHYRDVSSLNEIYGTNYAGFNEVVMPRRFEAKSKSELPCYLDWTAFREYMIYGALKRLADMLKQNGVMGIPVFHNYPAGEVGSPFNLVETERHIEIQGIDMYPTRREYESIKTACLHTAGTSRLPFMPEFSSGGWLWYQPITVEDQRFTTLATWMHGIKAINFYMLVERERWYGSPIARDGRIREEYYKFFKSFTAACKQSGLTQLEIKADIQLLHVRDYGRLENLTSLFGPISPWAMKSGGLTPEAMCREDTFGFKSPIQIEHDRVFKCWLKGLTASRRLFVIGDTAQDIESLRKRKIVIVPTFEFLGTKVQENLAEYATEGGILVVGPILPELDESMRHNETLKNVLGDKVGELNDMGDIYSTAAGKILVMSQECRSEDEFLQKLIETIDDIASLGGVKRHFSATLPGVETSFHAAPDDITTGVLFVANTTSKKKNSTIEIKSGLHLVDLMDGAEFLGDGAVEIPLEPFTIRMFEVKP